MRKVFLIIFLGYLGTMMCCSFLFARRGTAEHFFFQQWDIVFVFVFVIVIVFVFVFVFVFSNHWGTGVISNVFGRRGAAAVHLFFQQLDCDPLTLIHSPVLSPEWAPMHL